MAAPSTVAPGCSRADPFEDWRADVRLRVREELDGFLRERCTTLLATTGLDSAAPELSRYLGGGKCLRSTFVYLGWLSGAEECAAALRAAASFELLHTFALLQDDVMDESPVRRGRAAAHAHFAEWHRTRGLSGSAQRFGESAATLLGDLCLVWSEQMLRESGVAAQCLQRAWSRYDAMRIELALGQCADIVNDAARAPTLSAVLAVARAKSGNYTVCRPLEIGAAMAGCDERVLAALGGYGAAVGEAFQLRDDLLGVFGSASVTGKPTGGDLRERKATTVVVAAHEMATLGIRRELDDLSHMDDLAEADIARWRTLIVATGAVQRVEDMIAELVTCALDRIGDGGLHPFVRTALARMAIECTSRDA